MEAFIKDQKQMIHYLHKQAEDHVKTRNVLIQINEELEKEINVKDEEIMRLTKELRETTFKESNDVYKLLEEIDFIKNVNNKKEDTLADVMKENQSLHEDLQHLQEEVDVLKRDTAKVEVKEYEQTLDDELGISDPPAINVSPACEPHNLKILEEKSYIKIFEKKFGNLN